jgi:hypothetical protein
VNQEFTECHLLNIPSFFFAPMAPGQNPAPPYGQPTMNGALANATPALQWTFKLGAPSFLNHSLDAVITP